ncbi:peptidase C14 caspase catalytic subunit p20 [Mesorhizobium sp. M3A.F.Ca.ET.080.04.2.1]|uniref:caspase family protein n=1 Tax=unclassified Mesorhizobium TaxID=325217 RepID=UPI000F75FE6C|nr:MULTISPECIES: caspase domain-containing protein [unclassified Mesorhizobium]AZO09230.1 peptidase C14 caspase catalytic subunit p20 [Mesorhizobium sp. M3A.F.Ca.ET.080.04.2.1]RWE36334.1 MAG: peptidase C14 caspase catalytic subunit p20 [Mesorhizobium sp.]
MRTLQKFIGLVVALIVLAVAPATTALGQEQKRLAFVIGNAAYSPGELVTPANDAGLIAQTLQAAGFDVVGARDVDQESLRGAFRDFLTKVSEAGPDAVVFIFLAGRGVQFEGENYFLPVDAKIANPADVPIQAVRISDLTRPLAALPTKVNIVVLDAARPNALPRTNQPLAGGLALVDPDPNMLIAFNAAPGTVAPEGKGPYGAYAQALAEMMREGGLPLDELFDRVRLRVNEVTQGAQVPWNASKISAPFVFFDRAPDAPAPKVSEAEDQANRTREIRDFDADDAYVAALDRDTLSGYEEFLVAYPHDPMAKRVRAICAARREAITWRQTWMRDTPEAYWSYLDRYPHGPHAWDARRRLEHFDAELEPPPSFTVIIYDVPPPPEEEFIYVDRPVLYFDDPDFDFEPPPPVAIIFLPPPPPDFIVLRPPRRPVDVFVLPVPVFVPVPVWVRPPRYIVPPPNDIIFNNIHNTTVINTINNTTITNEASEARQPDGTEEGGLTAGRKVTAGGTAAMAARVALPPLLKKRAAIQQRKQPGVVMPLSKNESAGKLGTDHTLPGGRGKTLPLVNGRPVPNGLNLPGNASRKLLGKQGTVDADREATGNAAAAGKKGPVSIQGNDRKFRKLPTVNGRPAEQGLSVREKTRKYNPNVLSDRNDGKPRKLRRKDLSAGQSFVEPNDRAPAKDRGRNFRKLPTVNGAPADSRSSVQKRLRKNNPNVFSDQVQGPAGGGRKFRRLQNDQEGSAGAEINVQRNFKVNRPNENAQRQFKLQQNRNVEVFSKPQRPEFRAQPRPQGQPQERRLQQQPQRQPQQGNKRPVCGHPGEPPCRQ